MALSKATRVQNALRGLPTDRPPVSFWHHFSGAEAQGEACAEAHLRYYRESGIDFIKIMSDGYFEYPLAEIREPADWYKLKPLGAGHPFIREQIRRAQLINEGVKGECPTFYNVFAPFSSIRFGTSDELVMRHIREAPEAIIYALDVIALDNALLAELVVSEGGCEGVYYCLQGGEENRFSTAEYRQLITPSDRQVLDRANHQGSAILHMCGWAGIRNRLEVWRDYPADAVNWAVYVEGLGLREGRDFFGGKTVLGGLDNREGGALASGSREEVEQAVAELVRDAGTLGLMVGADCSLPGHIDHERIAWAVEAVQKGLS